MSKFDSAVSLTVKVFPTLDLFQVKEPISPIQFPDSERVLKKEKIAPAQDEFVSYGSEAFENDNYTPNLGKIRL